MDRPARWLAARIRARPIVVIVATMLLALGLSFGIPRLKFETGQDRLLDPNSGLSQSNARYQAQFGGDPMLVLFTAADGTDITQLFTPANRATMQQLQDDLNAGGDFASVLTPLAVVEFAKVADPAAHRLAAREARGRRADRHRCSTRGIGGARRDAEAAGGGGERGAAARGRCVQRGVRRRRQAVRRCRRADAGQPALRAVRAVRRGREHPAGAGGHLPGRPARADGRAAPGQPLDRRQRERRGADEAGPRGVPLRWRDDADVRTAAADQGDQRQDEERAGDHGDLRRRDHGRGAVPGVPRALAAALAAGGAHRLRVGVRADGVHRHPADDGDDLGIADPHRTRRRLRDPGAQPHGGGDAGDGVGGSGAGARVRAARAGARHGSARGVHRLHRAAPFGGADDPRLRVDAGGRRGHRVRDEHHAGQRRALPARAATRIGSDDAGTQPVRGGTHRAGPDGAHGRAAGADRGDRARRGAGRAVRQQQDPDADGSGEVRPLGQRRAEEPARHPRRRRIDKRGRPARRDARRQARHGPGRARLDAAVRGVGAEGAPRADAIEQRRVVHEVGDGRRADDGIGGAGAGDRAAGARRERWSTTTARWRRSCSRSRTRRRSASSARSRTRWSGTPTRRPASVYRAGGNRRRRGGGGRCDREQPRPDVVRRDRWRSSCCCWWRTGTP